MPIIIAMNLAACQSLHRLTLKTHKGWCVVKHQQINQSINQPTNQPVPVTIPFK